LNKEKTYKEKENEEKRGKKRFLERMVEDKEAQEEIESFLKHKEEKEEYEGRPTIRPFS
jgi:hypothetical protein